MKPEKRGWTGVVVFVAWFLSLLSLSLAEAGKWTKKADMPTPRSALATGVVDGIIYAIGGTPDNWRGLSAVEAYDPKTDTWSRKREMPTPRGWLSAAVVDGIIYAIGGFRDGEAVQTVEAYDPKTDTWTRRKEMPTPRGLLSTAVVDGRIYAIGGETAERAPFSTVEIYTPKTNRWTKGPRMPTARASLSTPVVDGTIYAIGGGVGVTFLATVEAYDPRSNRWRRNADMPLPLPVYTGVVGRRIYAIRWDRTVTVYDPVSDRWTEQAALMPTRRAGAAISVVDGRLYVIGGTIGARIVFPTVEVYDTGVTGRAALSRQKRAMMWGAVKIGR